MLDHVGLTTPNFELLGWDPMVNGSRHTTSFYVPCGDAKPTTDGRRLAIVESEGDVAFALADVTNPRAPRFLGELIMKTTQEYDVALAPDGKHVLMVTELPKQPEAPSDPVNVPMWRSACDPTPHPIAGWPMGPGDDLLPRPNSLLLISIVDPTAPSVVDQRLISGVGHGVSSTLAGGRTWVAVAAWGAVNALGTYQFYEITNTPAGPKLGYLSTFNVPPGTDTADLTRGLGHNDVWIQKHPKTGQLLAWMAHWHHGLMVVDLTNPNLPRQIGQWSDYDPTRPVATGGMHSLWIAPEMWGDKHYVVTGPELGGHPKDQPTGTVWVVDTTDPTRPRPVAAWTLPYDVQWTKGGEWSGHYLTVVNRTAFITMYHGGVWAIDLRDLGAPFHSLPSVGVFVPDRESPNPARGVSPWSPMLGEVHAFPDGTMVTFEATSGIYSFRYNDSSPMPAPTPWPIPKPLNPG
jgi:hypothetical protein